MLTHIVAWKYRADVEQFAREEHVNLLRNLRDMIPEAQSLSVGFDTLHLPRSYDTGLVAVFADRAALDPQLPGGSAACSARFAQVASSIKWPSQGVLS